jgi:glutaredoxin 3
MSNTEPTPMLRIVTKRTCGYCMAAKRLLDGLGMPYQEIDVTGDPARHAELRAQTRWPTVPIVSIGERVIGGYQELASLHRSGELDALRSP